MHKVLIAADGSEHSERAVRYLIGLILDGGLLAGNVEVHLVNVQTLLSARVAQGMSRDELDRYYLEKSTLASRRAIDLLKNEGIAFTFHALQGDAASRIVACSQSLGCDSIFLGSQGNGVLEGIFLGSVAAKVTQLSSIPITLVK
ncbi:universal stress protein [Pseudomonas sp. SWRI92]|uniref:Universal stress protein n=1 Tax=Pseudomonas marvdashtae TaxID=2745500 RepID=A0A923FKW5_9PSED|nr:MULTISPECIES: universal stress protein [Pseudomonas]MBC3372366.1 universal stress protein [Pseudomonas sp. SWRI92]MBV4551511.1 universal stress protein [Pseudomonas marvdashtae]